MTANQSTFLAELISILKQPWPSNRTVNMVCHGHSVPSGYFATPIVDTFNAYPHPIFWSAFRITFLAQSPQSHRA